MTRRHTLLTRAFMMGGVGRHSVLYPLSLRVRGGCQSPYRVVALLVAHIADLQQITLSCFVQLRLDISQVRVHALPELSDLAQQRPAAMSMSCGYVLLSCNGLHVIMQV